MKSVPYIVAACLALAVSRTPAAPVDFNRDVRPILSAKCFACHGPDAAKREAELRLDVERDAKGARDGKPAIVAGEPGKSELVRRITATDRDEVMPPPATNKTLSVAEIDVLKRWIAEGAKWSLPWAYVAPKRQPMPETRQTGRALNWIDPFIQSRLEAAGLSPAADADSVTLLRRLSIDLVGLPPRPAEAELFLADKNPDATERLVDRLLASPRFGERMAVTWLDWVRYADTVGYHGDQEQHISPYRDWVIGALNQSMPFDQFTREQLAGDLLPGSTQQQKIATGYNRMLQTSHEGGVQAKEYLSIYAADRVRNVSAVWLGATVGCAQCHDHKFDPYTARDFYSLAAFFADVDEAQHLTKGADRSPTVRYPEMELPTAEQANYIATLEARLAKLKGRSSALTLDRKKQQAEIADLQKQLNTVRAKVRRTMITVSIEPREMRILPRGNWLDDSGPIVLPSVPEALGRIDSGNRRATRLDLANWLTDPRSGIGGQTSRVMVNRYWQMFFGAGLSPSLDDFGGQGEPPSHPELLDQLAVEWLDAGWDVKQIVRQIVSSRTYRQSSVETAQMRERDPNNRLVARQGRFRYPAEAVRDSLLGISGLLVERLGGPSVRPYQPAGYYRHLNFPIREYAADNDDGQWRRGLYVHWQRQYLHPMLKAFDAPSREECTAQRPQSNTALAALVLLNDPSSVEAARALAERVLVDARPTRNERIAFAFQRAVTRQPTPEELRRISELFQASADYYRRNDAAAKSLVSIGNKKARVGVDVVELAAWTVACRSVLTMQETTTRN